MNKEFTIEILAQGEHSVRFRIKKKGEFLSFKEVFTLWAENVGFIKFYKEALIAFGYQAFYWEHPAINEAFLEKKYECILQRSKPLENLQSNENTFKEYIHANNQVADFMNLGKNARLIVPTKQTDQEVYNHLGKFINFAKDEQIIKIFQQLGDAVLEELKEEKAIWLNTAGLGVIWLHIRLDTKPKYYKTKLYKNIDFLNKVK